MKKRVSNKRKKVSNINTHKTELPKKVTLKVLDRGFSQRFTEKFYIRGASGINNEMLEELAAILLKWVSSRSDIYIFVEFLNLQKILLKTFLAWCKRCPKLEEAKQLAFQQIAENREKAALSKNPEGIAFRHVQHVYSKQWDEANRYHAALKTLQDNDNLSREEIRDLIADILKPIE